MPYFTINMVDPQGNELDGLWKFSSLDEAQAYAAKSSFANENNGCVATDVNIWKPELPVFEFEARDPQGALIADIIESASQDEALSLIENMGYTVTKIQSCDITK